MSSDFIGEFEVMDLEKLKKENFMVAISNGKRDEYGFLCSSLIGPLDFTKMVEKVHHLYSTRALHAKAMICGLDFQTPPKFLDENTIDYIEAHGPDIVMNHIMGIESDEAITCEAGYNVSPKKTTSKPNKKDVI